jgi:Fic family protein
MVGWDASSVPYAMCVFADEIGNVAQQANLVEEAPRTLLKQAEKIAIYVKYVAALFVYFLEIHPYANGNGHMARFILSCFLARYKLFLSRFKVHPRPQDPPYSVAIANYRRGRTQDLERFILSCL